MNKVCQHITQAIDLAVTEGNKIYCLDPPKNETEKFIVWLYDPIDLNVKEKIDLLGENLSYWEWKGGPHDPATKGCTCDQCNVVLIFPGVRTPRIGEMLKSSSEN